MASSDLLGDFGARDPFPAEIESTFCENVVGNVDTEHKILIPTLSSLSLSQRSCEAVSPSQPPMPLEEVEKLLKKGYKVGAVAGHYPHLHLEPPSQVTAKLWTSSIGGLCLNDFIVAAKIDQIKTLDLLPKKRIGA